jgi:hypothetical protein
MIAYVYLDLSNITLISRQSYGILEADGMKKKRPIQA